MNVATIGDTTTDGTLSIVGIGIPTAYIAEVTVIDRSGYTRWSEMPYSRVRAARRLALRVAPDGRMVTSAKLIRHESYHQTPYLTFRVTTTA